METGTQGQVQMLVALLDEHLEEIATATAARICELPGSRYQELGLAELIAAARRAVQAIVEALRTGSYSAMKVYLADLSRTRWQMGFDIREVTEALLLCKEAALPVVWRAFSSDPALVQESSSQLDACLRWMIAQFARMHSAQVKARVEEQQARTALMLEMAQTASSTLDEDEVLRRVAKGIAAAVGVEYCGLFLVDDEQQTITPRLELTVPPILQAGIAHGLPSPRPPRPIAAYSAFLREVVEQKRPAVAYDVQTDPRFEPEGVTRKFGFRSVLGAPLVANGRVVAVAYAFTFDESCIFREEQIELAWGLALSAAVAIQNARLYDESVKRLAKTQSLQRVTAALLQEHDLEEVLKVVGREAHQLTGARGSGVCLLEDDAWLRVVFCDGEAPLSVGRLPVGESLVGLAVREGKAVLSNDPAGDARVYQGDAKPTALLVVPLTVKGVHTGALCVVNKPNGFVDQDIDLISIFADQAAIAIEGARLREQVRHLAVLEERERLAREMHDNLAQALGVLHLKLSLAETHLADEDLARARADLLQAKEVTRETCIDVREAIFGLRIPESLEMGFWPTLQEHLSEYKAHYGIDVRLVVEAGAALELAPDVELQVMRIIQEALTNVRKHAATSKAWIRVEPDCDRVCISVEDNGRGFDLAQIQGQGQQCFGLQVMRERVESVGGVLEICSHPGQGTLVVIWAPLAPGK